MTFSEEYRRRQEEREREQRDRQRKEFDDFRRRNEEQKHREAQERHWRRMEQQNRRSPIVTGLAVYGAYKAYEALSSDDDEEQEIEELRRQNAELQEKLRELMLKKSGRADPGLGQVQHSQGDPTPASEPIRHTKLRLFFLLACVMSVLAVYALFNPFPEHPPITRYCNVLPMLGPRLLTGNSALDVGLLERAICVEPSLVVSKQFSIFFVSHTP